MKLFSQTAKLVKSRMRYSVNESLLFIHAHCISFPNDCQKFHGKSSSIYEWNSLLDYLPIRIVYAPSLGGNCPCSHRNDIQLRRCKFSLARVPRVINLSHESMFLLHRLIVLASIPFIQVDATEGKLFYLFRLLLRARLEWLVEIARGNAKRETKTNRRRTQRNLTVTDQSFCLQNVFHHLLPLLIAPRKDTGYCFYRVRRLYIVSRHLEENFFMNISGAL